MKIVILEDNCDRQGAMKSCLLDRFHQYDIVIFDNARTMCDFLETNLTSALLICLDHDLELPVQQNGKVTDPGSGRDVADWLALKPACCPIVIHTTNSAAGDGMEFLLRDAQWQVQRVHPYGDLEWIPAVWFRAVRDAIVSSAQPRSKVPS